MRKFGPVKTIPALGLAALAALCVGVPVAAQSGQLAMLASLNKGGWNLRIRDDGTQQRVCVRDGQEFIQLRHKQAGCSRFIVQDNADEVVVQYTCRGNGYGRTSIRREGNGLVQIQSQGIYEGLPFAITAEARHNGSC
jgi:hypothetical protein